MSESMVERVAKAIWDAGNRHGFDWENAGEPKQEDTRKQACAAIEAMREPTAAMEWAALSGPPPVIWRRMIDAALAEKEP